MIGKNCPKCGEEKPLVAFARNRANRDGYSCYCRPCGSAYRALHKDKLRESAYAWRAANPERHKANNDRDRAKHVDRVRKSACVSSGLRRARQRDATVTEFSAADIAQRWAYYGNKCWICRDVATATDHVKPLSRGGPHVLANLRPICKPCNSHKKNTWPLSAVEGLTIKLA